MANHNSAVERGETPHTKPTDTNSTKQFGSHTNRRISMVHRRRAESVLNDRSVDPDSRAIIRYALDINDPWLAELVQRATAGERLAETVDFSQEPQVKNDDDFEVEKIEALTEMICRGGDEPGTKSAALLALMAALENSPNPKALANTAKHLAFNHCSERNLCAWWTRKFACSKQNCFRATRSLRKSFTLSRFPLASLFHNWRESLLAARSWRLESI